jgi:hypothetical protein
MTTILQVEFSTAGRSERNVVSARTTCGTVHNRETLA